jgi:hypothetical protein
MGTNRFISVKSIRRNETQVSKARPGPPVGVTKEVTFQGVATFNRNGTIAGRAKTTFNFATFGLNKPTIVA